MRRKNVLPKVIFSLMFISVAILPGYCEAVYGQFERLKSELRKQGVSDEFIKAAENPVERMIAAAAPIADIKSVLLDLWQEGVRARALKNAVVSVAELVESGDNILEAAKVSSAAAHKAESEGLSGFSVAMRVKKAVGERKAYLKAIEK